MERRFFRETFSNQSSRITVSMELSSEKFSNICTGVFKQVFEAKSNVLLSRYSIIFRHLFQNRPIEANVCSPKCPTVVFSLPEARGDKIFCKMIKLVYIVIGGAFIPPGVTNDPRGAAARSVDFTGVQGINFQWKKLLNNCIKEATTFRNVCELQYFQYGSN